MPRKKWTFTDEQAARQVNRQAYYKALGRFLDMFAKVETAVTLTLWKYAGTPTEVSKVIFAGTKIEVGSAHIKQLAEAINASQHHREDLTKVLQQLGIINGVRNAILHYGATSIEEGNAIVSNALKAKGEPTVFPISPQDLDDMTWDLLSIITHLNHIHLARQQTGGGGILDAALAAPWRYKHPLPPKAPPKKEESRPQGKRHPKPPPPPESSQE